MMARTYEKIFLGVLVVVILGLGSLIGVALNSGNEDDTLKSNKIGNSNQQQKISYEQAMSIASAWYDGAIAKIEVENADGREVYSIEFEEGNQETAVIIDPYTGQVLKIEREDKLGRRELQMISPKISKEQAKALALSAVNGKIAGVGTKKINGVYVYEVEIKNEGEEAEILVNMMTGKIIGIESESAENDNEQEESDEDDLSQQELANIKTSVTEQEAIQIALKQVSGEVTDVEIERKQGHEVYAVEINDNGDEVDVFVDVKTGEVVGTERDSEEDDEDD